MKTFSALILVLLMWPSVAWSGSIIMGCIGCEALHNMGTVQLAMKYPSGPYKDQVLDLVKSGVCRPVHPGTRARQAELKVYDSQYGTVQKVAFTDGSELYVPSVCFSKH